MAYATATDMVERFPEQRLAELTDDNAVAVNLGRLDQALADASAEIDTYLGRRYVLPLTRQAPVLIPIACDIAYWRLMSFQPQATTEDPARRHKAAVALLTAIGAGDAELYADGPVSAGGPSASAAIVSGPRRIFDRDSLRGY